MVKEFESSDQCMAPNELIYPFESNRCIGTVCEVTPSSVKANFPNAVQSDGNWLHGHKLDSGHVGGFVVIECGDQGVFGRIINVSLPDRDRLAVESRLGIQKEAHPIGIIQLLTTIKIKTEKVSGGIDRYPKLGNRVFAAHPELIKWLAESTQKKDDATNSVLLNMATLSDADDTIINIIPERIFGRHCAVLGATGGGKSWTVARLLEQSAQFKSKIILLDATGEFQKLTDRVLHVQIGEGSPQPTSCTKIVFPYSDLSEGDVFALFKPSGQTQAPKLRQAIRTLKLSKLETALDVTKVNKTKKPIEDAYQKHINAIENQKSNFEITKLSKQIEEECVYPSGGTFQAPDYTKWGGYNLQEKSYCFGLIARIEDMINSKDLECIFKPGQQKTLIKLIDEFLSNTDQSVLRISLKYLPFAHNAREVVANAIGRHLLELARNGTFAAKPLIIFVDEAHQFLNKTLGDENSKYHLDAFDLIAKEGRKFSLNICIATQRPRDIPEGVLSQMGTLIVHRLINDKDREVVERASGDIDKSAAAFLPTLAPGEAAIIGVDFPIPLTVQISRPTREPESKGADYQKHWV